MYTRKALTSRLFTIPFITRFLRFYLPFRRTLLTLRQLYPRAPSRMCGLKRFSEPFED